MKRKTAMAVVLMAAFSGGATLVQAQTDGGGPDESIRALLREVRNLREAVEKQSASTTRAQLLVTRLTLQDQRLTKAQAAVDQMTESIEAQKAQIARVRAALASGGGMDKPTDAASRDAYEQRIKWMKDELSRPRAEDDGECEVREESATAVGIGIRRAKSRSGRRRPYESLTCP
ncbi:MAG: hypothetical protein ABI672_00230 [Vicinamibacteria bacterium]